ncbi:hypothetical protein Ait01nite_048310 [Actinoplanes italicus]|uniref:Excalibur calcium-binding domain-containing protein n=1 Tax=Actinoplanes italicus TaxID=113567 RepID=A0A2T0K9X0_9ACTN|nr:hypothetical protein [Actinoplanes italicus]PRX19933.1 hypothetical protein CLV67_109198 [Actinoplanes italicus]GIE31786.1 hypothetical protein Ait01nite_048310 [Actinoplanes italicus]
MSRTRLAAVVLTAVAVAAGVSWVGLDSRDPGTIRTTSVAARGVLPTVSPSAGGPAAATKGAGTATTPEKAAKTTKPVKHATPAPFVQTFAGQPGITRQKPKRKPTAPVRVAPTVDGCDRNYGTIAHCVPVRFPAGVTDKCVWLREHGFKNLKVAAKDSQKLDSNRNGVACDE